MGSHYFWAFATLAPQYCFYQLIATLETGSKDLYSRASLWLALLGLSHFIQPWTETWVLWVGWCHVALPIYVQLSGLMVGKSMHKKDTKDIGVDNSGLGPESVNNGNEGRAAVISGKTHDQINLITINAQRLTDFLSYNSQLGSKLPARAIVHTDNEYSRMLGILLNVILSFSFLLSFLLSFIRRVSHAFYLSMIWPNVSFAESRAS